MPKPLTPHHEPSHENNHLNQALPNPYIKDTPTTPQVISHPPFPIFPNNSHVTHTQVPFQGKKAHLLEDKQIPSVKVFDEVSFYTLFQEALRGNTRDLDSIWKETGQDFNFTPSGFKYAHTVPEDGVTISSDAVRTYKRRRQELCDGVRT
uniref:Uncharacterized protein n=1 Tax=Tanacetum cinerariifolium TaxID=118510 RepID=A0A6L2KUK5_TANCI|nr:hypothetical protein [Tanacetum cinerariifolium]